ncbi:hypothetical protein HELRODRAFT_159356 [Helobdella robusta]|uniref:Uncharacterized protein n=1 Tax=Helobdella robusta TaxID=6412 RepID=T1ENX6_HELRO|nr:hypothetical protein HELRODRAFT_159356 [Helobdella robusta]ESO12772.1 hypothetical protein HELRODRAFT_159356 [Helobdella robusta]
MLGKGFNLNPYEINFKIFTAIEREEKKRLIWYKKYWLDCKREFPCNQLDRTRRIVDANLYEESQDLVLKHENLLKANAVVEQRKRLPYQDLYKRNLLESLKQMRGSLPLPNDDCLYQKMEDDEVRKEHEEKLKCDIHESVRNVRYRTGVIASALEKMDRDMKRAGYVPRDDYSNYDTESSDIGWRCHEAASQNESNHRKFHFIKYLSQPNGALL